MKLRYRAGVPKFSALVAAMLLTAGCTTLEREGVLAPPEGGAVTVRDGAPFVVSLSPEPAAGYGWILKSTGPGVVFVGGPDVTVDPKPPSILGIPATTTFRFRAKAPGTTAVEFTWVAPPGQSVAAERSVRYDVTVTPTKFFGIL